MTKLGKYELHEQLGRGGFGTVYRAIDTSLGREVALKVLHPQLTTDPDFLEHFRNEARLVASLKSANIVAIYDLAEADGRIFIVMEYLSGGSLKQKLEKEGALSVKRTFVIIKQICNGLKVAHKKGLVHRDIKPGNILFDSEGMAVIGDFGLARAIQMSSVSAASSTGGVGTPAYRAPELWIGKPPASPATDIYSLGCVLSEMLTGKVLFDADSTDVVITQHLVVGPQISNELSPSIQKILKKALSKDPNDRYLNVGLFETAVEETEDKIGNTESSKKGESLVSQVRAVEEIKPIYLYPNDDKDLDHVLEKENLAPNDYKLKKSREAMIKGIGLALCGIVILFLIIGNTCGWFKAKAVTVIPTNTPTTIDTVTIVSSILKPTITSTEVQTVKPTVTATKTPDLSAAPEFPAGTVKISVKDKMPMVYIPAGEFTMGSPEGIGKDSEHPQHQVYLSNYWIDQTEVTNGMFELCVAKGGCVPPNYTNSNTRESYYGNPAYDNYPVINVDWNDARQYCRWAGRTLPTEAQWEKAARGSNGYTYPWGTKLPDKNLANYDSNIGDTTEVGSYPEGASPYGALDMAGNVDEWVWEKWFYEYPSELVSDPVYNQGNNGRILRGGSWYYIEDFLRTAERHVGDPEDLWNFIGFRCALSGNVSP